MNREGSGGANNQGGPNNQGSSLAPSSSVGTLPANYTANTMGASAAAAANTTGELSELTYSSSMKSKEPEVINELVTFVNQARSVGLQEKFRVTSKNSVEDVADEIDVELIADLMAVLFTQEELDSFEQFSGDERSIVELESVQPELMAGGSRKRRLQRGGAFFNSLGKFFTSLYKRSSQYSTETDRDISAVIDVGSERITQLNHLEFSAILTACGVSIDVISGSNKLADLTTFACNGMLAVLPSWESVLLGPLVSVIKYVPAAYLVVSVTAKLAYIGLFVTVLCVVKHYLLRLGYSTVESIEDVLSGEGATGFLKGLLLCVCGISESSGKAITSTNAEASMTTWGRFWKGRKNASNKAKAARAARAAKTGGERIQEAVQGAQAAAAEAQTRAVAVGTSNDAGGARRESAAGVGFLPEPLVSSSSVAAAAAATAASSASTAEQAEAAERTAELDAIMTDPLRVVPTAVAAQLEAIARQGVVAMRGARSGDDGLSALAEVATQELERSPSARSAASAGFTFRNASGSVAFPPTNGQAAMPTRMNTGPAGGAGGAAAAAAPAPAPAPAARQGRKRPAEAAAAAEEGRRRGPKSGGKRTRRGKHTRRANPTKRVKFANRGKTTKCSRNTQRR
jgi:hypothetical protein